MCEKKQMSLLLWFCVISDQAINSYEINIIARQMSLPFYSKDV